MTCKAWNLAMNPAGAFAQQAAALTGLSAKVQRALARCLCLAAVGLQDNAQRDHYIQHLLHNVAGEFVVQNNSRCQPLRVDAPQQHFVLCLLHSVAGQLAAQPIAMLEVLALYAIFGLMYHKLVACPSGLQMSALNLPHCCAFDDCVAASCKFCRIAGVYQLS